MTFAREAGIPPETGTAVGSAISPEEQLLERVRTEARYEVTRLECGAEKVQAQVLKKRRERVLLDQDRPHGLDRGVGQGDAQDRDPERRHEDRSPGLRGGRGGGARGSTSGSTLLGGSGALEGGRGPRTSLGPSQLFGSSLLLRAFGRPLRSTTALGGRTGRPL